MTAALATIGHNSEPTPFRQSREEIEALFVEAGHWLDGSGVQSEADATAVSKLLDLLRQAEKRADERRKEEAEPHDKAKAEIQARYGALIGNTKTVKGKAILAMECCKKALALCRALLAKSPFITTVHSSTALFSTALYSAERPLLLASIK